MKIDLNVHNIDKNGIKFYKLKPGENSVIENMTSKTLQVIILPIYNGVSYDVKSHFNHKKGGSKQ